MNGNIQNTSEQENIPKKGTLMIAEDDALLLKIFERFFSKHYNLITCKSGNEALEIIKKGSRPEVILSDQRMPGLSGDEFLAESIKYIPDSIRVIITAHSDPKEIISAINRAHTYMFLSKPIEEIELVQAVRLCFTHYYTTQRNKALMREIQEKRAAETQVAAITKPQSFDKTIIEINKNFSVLNTYYYKNFLEVSLPILKAFMDSLKVSVPMQEKIFISFNIYIYISNFIPPKYLINDPENFSQQERDLYFSIFKSLLDRLLGYENLSYYCAVVNQIWENFDGSGFPNGISGDQILNESQIIKLVLMYVNNVYRIPLEVYDTRMQLSEYKQPLAITTHRHKSMTKYVFDRTKWFEPNIVNNFRFLLQDNSIEAFHFERRDLVIPNFEYDISRTNKMRQQEIERAEAEEAESMASTPQERTIKISELTPGMMSSHSITTKSGILVCRQETTLTPQLIANIQRLDTSGQLTAKGVIDVIIPPQE